MMHVHSTRDRCQLAGRHRRGFTLIELLVVMAIIGLLAAISVPTISRAIDRARRTQAQTEVRSILIAVRGFYNEYNRLPVPASDQGGPDQTYEDAGSRTIIEILTGEDTQYNPRRTQFLEPKGERGEFLDPWGQQYVLILDTNYDREVTYEGDTYRTIAVVYSEGPPDLSPREHIATHGD